MAAFSSTREKTALLLEGSLLRRPSMMSSLTSMWWWWWWHVLCWVHWKVCDDDENEEDKDNLWSKIMIMIDNSARRFFMLNQFTIKKFNTIIHQVFLVESQCANMSIYWCTGWSLRQRRWQLVTHWTGKISLPVTHVFLFIFNV